MVQQSIEQTVTWGQILSVANTVLVAIVVFLVKDAWSTMHKRVGNLEKEFGSIREDLSFMRGRYSGEHKQRYFPEMGEDLP